MIGDIRICAAINCTNTFTVKLRGEFRIYCCGNCTHRMWYRKSYRKLKSQILFCARPKCRKEFSTPHPTKIFCSTRCKRAETSRQQYINHRDQRLKDWGVFYQSHKREVSAKSRRWYLRNKDRAKINHIIWKSLNPDKSRFYISKRRHLQRSSTPRDEAITLIEWAFMKEAWNFACAYCGLTKCKLTQDHVIPISKGGKHIVDNIVPACIKCNQRKSAQDLEVFLARQASWDIKD